MKSQNKRDWFFSNLAPVVASLTYFDTGLINFGSVALIMRIHMRIEELVETIRAKNVAHGEPIAPRPCTKGEILAAEKKFMEWFDHPFAEAYKRILRKTNGIFCNGLTIWPIEKEPGFLETMLEANEQLEIYYSGEFLYFGEFEDNLYVFDKNSSEYVEMAFVGKSPRKRFENVDTMYEFMLERALNREFDMKPDEGDSKNHEPSPSEGIENQHQVGDTVTVLLPGGIEMEFCYIPAGEFLMGASEEEVNAAFENAKKHIPDIKLKDFSCEQPIHRVVISRPFWMGKYQVTRRQWAAVMGRNPSDFIDQPERPVEDVTWNICQRFINRLNAIGDGNVYSLPTEAQWEYACRAGTTTPFSFGQTLSSKQANFDASCPFGDEEPGDFLEYPVAVGTIGIPNAWGLCDMHGNVSEWCNDFFDKDYYSSSPTVDPNGPETGNSRVQRGGNFFSSACFCRSASRHGINPLAANLETGLRIVMQNSNG